MFRHVLVPVFIAGAAACASSLPSELPVLGGVDGWRYREGEYTISFDIRPSPMVLWSCIFAVAYLYNYALLCYILNYILNYYILILN